MVWWKCLLFFYTAGTMADGREHIVVSRVAAIPFLNDHQYNNKTLCHHHQRNYIESTGQYNITWRAFVEVETNNDFLQ